MGGGLGPRLFWVREEVGGGVGVRGAPVPLASDAVGLARREEGRVEGRDSPAWHSITRCIACESVRARGCEGECEGVRVAGEDTCLSCFLGEVSRDCVPCGEVRASCRAPR